MSLGERNSVDAWSAGIQGKLLRLPVTLVLLCAYVAAGLASRGHISEPKDPRGPGTPSPAVLSPVQAAWDAYLPSTSHLTAFILGAVFIALVALWVETRMGSLRFLVAFLFTQSAALASGAVFVALIQPDAAVHRAEPGLLVGVTVIACGTAMAATAGLRVMWRRRLRTGLLAVVLVTALYAGTLPDVMRLGAVLIGLLLGPLLIGQRPGRPRIRATRHEGRVLVAVVICAAALGPVVAALSPGAVGPLAVLRYLGTNIVPVDPQSLAELCSSPERINECAAAQLQQRAGLGAMFSAVLPSILLVVLADGLRRGRRLAWWAAAVVQGAMAGLTLIFLAGVVLQARVPDAGLLEGLGEYDFTDYGQAKAIILPLLAPLAVFLLLLATRRLFSISAPPRVNRRLLQKILLLGVFLSALYLGVGFWLREGFRPVPDLGELAENLPERFVPLVYALHISPEFVPITAAATILFEGLGILFWAAVCLWLLASFITAGDHDSTADGTRARALVREGTGGTFSWMTTWEGNSYWFAPDGRSFIAYRVTAGVALTTSNPIAAPQDVAAVVRGFAGYCISHAWIPCFYSVTSEVADALPPETFSRVRVATETVLPLGSMAFTGKKFQDVRTALNRAEKSGVEAVWSKYSLLTLNRREQLRAISEEWVADRGMPELGFTLGGLAELDDPEVRLLLAVDDAGVLQGATSWLPVRHCGQVTGWTLDFMRRKQGGFRPVVEFLIGTAALTLQAQGYSFASLSGAPLVSANKPQDTVSPTGDDTGVPPMERVLGWLAATLEPVYGFQSLMSFKKKFQPQFVPQYMVYPDAAALPAISVAISKAYIGDASLSAGWSLARTLLSRH
ncbi:bifunctional lysylphosphatidylglycerol flippase/synthetase MprF [Arthrobacter rhombi]|uniref:bifunctional lysylphosphatidylglycerol flippase/synthetase MprF n=1 Tax=Arthrobacter rhombi TaxID=71253 RepID=UPI003FD508EE